MSGVGLGSGDLQGIGLGFVGVDASNVSGIAAGGVGVGADDVQGIVLGGVGVGCDEIQGAALSVGYLKSGLLKGFGTGAYTQVREAHGLCIGVFNRTDVLRGVQIGVLNYAGNNPRGLQWLPGINAHF